MISKMFAQKDIDRIFAACHVQPVGNGYIDCICLRKNVRTFLEELARIGVSITDYSVWQWVSHSGETVWGMGGPYNSFGDGWYSELDILRSWQGIDEMERFLTTEERRLSCILVPGLWLDVPVDWRRI